MRFADAYYASFKKSWLKMRQRYNYVYSLYYKLILGFCNFKDMKILDAIKKKRKKQNKQTNKQTKTKTKQNKQTKKQKKKDRQKQNKKQKQKKQQQQQQQQQKLTVLEVREDHRTPFGQ